MEQSSSVFSGNNIPFNFKDSLFVGARGLGGTGAGEYRSTDFGILSVSKNRTPSRPCSGLSGVARLENRTPPRPLWPVWGAALVAEVAFFRASSQGAGARHCTAVSSSTWQLSVKNICRRLPSIPELLDPNYFQQACYAFYFATGFPV